MNRGLLMVKYHLGCGNKRMDGFINIDAMPSQAVDVPGDITNLYWLVELTGRPDEIQAHHTIEHISFRKTDVVLQHWFGILKPGGTIRLSCPDLDECWDAFKKTGDWFQFCVGVYGNQKDHRLDFHTCGFTFDILKKMLENAGFTKIKRIKPSELGLEVTARKENV